MNILRFGKEGLLECVWVIPLLTLSYTGFFGLAGHGGEGGGIQHTFIALVLFDGFELNLVQ